MSSQSNKSAHVFPCLKKWKLEEYQNLADFVVVVDTGDDFVFIFLGCPFPHKVVFPFSPSG